MEALWEREIWTDAYVPVWRHLDTADGGKRALVFEVNVKSGQFAGELPDYDASRFIATASGKYGSCREYLLSTFEALRDAGIQCPEICKMRAAVYGLSRLG